MRILHARVMLLSGQMLHTHAFAAKGEQQVCEQQVCSEQQVCFCLLYAFRVETISRLHVYLITKANFDNVASSRYNKAKRRTV